MNDANSALNAIAARYGVPRAEVEREISAAIQQAMRHPSPLVQQRWKALFPDGKPPTPEQFLEKLSMLL